MRIQLRSADVSALMERVKLLLEIVKKRFPGKWDGAEVRKVGLKDIYEFQEKYAIKFIPVDMQGKSGEAFACKIASEDGRAAKYAIVVNENILKLPKSVSDRILKSILLHEICHILGSHDGAVAYKAGTANEIRKESFANYQELRPGQNSEAELLSSILAFWPNTEFVRQMKNTQADFRQMANLYKMPVDCLLKWVVLQFADSLHIHYFKWNVDGNHVEDSFGNQEAWIIKDPDTAFSKACRDRCDSSSNKKDISCICRAYYEDKNFQFNKTSDKVLVLGLNRDEFVRFCATEDRDATY